ncbi:tetratricopeptide repeat-containing sulfotransferase family protein [Sneathiella glossodoripedis]|uniref:tetratricopeptide repeat-containing sulfotransferase family protein n=1 Tax=Sneathiella glossodoripedis TaxID=418853 RepID=UPI000A92A641|nr:sulfotransferase [Sneathiella glossodoripedis]
MNRALKRKQALKQKKEAKKLVLSPASTGLTNEQLVQLKNLMTLADTAYAIGKFGEAEKACKLALAMYPKYADPLHLLGGIALQMDKYSEAALLFEKALSVAPDAPITLNNYSIALKFLNRHEEALVAINKSLRLKPNYHEALNNKGSVLTVLGKMDESMPFFERAVKANPLFGKAYYNIATGHKFKEGDKFSKLMKSAEAKLSEMSETDQMNMHFGLGKYYEDIKDYKVGFGHYLKGNEIKRKSISYKVESAEDMMRKMETVFPENGNWQERTEVGAQSDLPIFVLGVPRSGTTLTEQILASHPEVFGAGELKLLSTAANGLAVNNSGFFPTEETVLKKFEAEVRRRGNVFIDELRKYDSKAKHITDKMPQNFRFIGLIHMLMPNAKIIHCRRNPIDTCLSNFRILFGEKMEYTYSLQDMGRYYLAYDRLMKHWEKVLPGRFLTVQYEDVVADLEGQARRIIDHVGLEWDDRCLDFHKTKRNVHTASSTQVRQPIYNSSIGRYERYGELLKPLLDTLEPVLDN